jgi:hypothetical protein
VQVYRCDATLPILFRFSGFFHSVHKNPVLSLALGFSQVIRNQDRFSGVCKFVTIMKLEAKPAFARDLCNDLVIGFTR